MTNDDLLEQILTIRVIYDARDLFANLPIKPPPTHGTGLTSPTRTSKSSRTASPTEAPENDE